MVAEAVCVWKTEQVLLSFVLHVLTQIIRKQDTNWRLETELRNVTELARVGKALRSTASPVSGSRPQCN